MKLIRVDNPLKKAFGFATAFAVYGIIEMLEGGEVVSKKYRLDLNVPFMDNHLKFLLPIKLYYSTKKPLLRHLGVIGDLWFPFYILLAIAFILLIIFIIATEILIRFYTVTLIKRSYITDSIGLFSGVISFVFSLIGLGAIVYLLFIR